jgi:hypothetical protein
VQVCASWTCESSRQISDATNDDEDITIAVGVTRMELQLLLLMTDRHKPNSLAFGNNLLLVTPIKIV